MRVLSLGAILVVAAFAAAREPARDPLDVSTGAELEEALSGPRHDAVIRLAPGVYELTPEAAFDSTYGSDFNPSNVFSITVGLTVSGRNLRIEGPSDGVATIVTHAGYGLYFKDCVDCELERISITGGVRDSSPDAPDAAIVAAHSSLSIRNCVIADNTGVPPAKAQDLGIMGICGREGADLTVEQCEIVHNSSNGIALYRDARATITNNLIDGVDATGGLGRGIDVTSDAHAVVERNLIARHSNGIRIRDDASVVVRGNIVEAVTWGIWVSSYGPGAPYVVIERNVVYDCAACGIALNMGAEHDDREPPGRLIANIVVHTRQDSQLDDLSFCRPRIHDGISIRGNVYYDNREIGEDPFGKNTTEEMFWRERRGWVRTFRNTGVGVDGRIAFHSSAFLTAYPRWWN